MFKRRKQEKNPTEIKRDLYKLDIHTKISISFLLIFPADILSVFLFTICKGGDWLSLLLVLVFLPFKIVLPPFFSNFHVFLYF